MMRPQDNQVMTVRLLNESVHYRALRNDRLRRNGRMVLGHIVFRLREKMLGENLHIGFEQTGPL